VHSGASHALISPLETHGRPHTRVPPYSGAVTALKELDSERAQNPCQIPPVMEGVVSIRGHDI
jgi:hypothetical protein